MKAPMDKLTSLNVLPFESPDGSGQPAVALLRGCLETIEDDGRLIVSTEEGQRLACDWLETSELCLSLMVGDKVLVATTANSASALVVGRIGRYRDPSSTAPVAHLRLDAVQSVSLVCGESSINLRADGKVLIRGDDVLVRAKGTKRIRAGAVSIN